MITARCLLPIALLLGCASPAMAKKAPAPDPMAAFHPGPLIPAFGKVTTVADPDVKLAADTEFRVAFDVSTAKESTLNHTLEGAARFLNMHAEAGIPAGHQHLAIVVHGPAIFDVSSAAAYARKYEGSTNPNAPLVAALKEQGVRIIVCGQSAAAQGIAKADLLPGVELALSAMTAHALLQQQGYTLNPF